MKQFIIANYKLIIVSICWLINLIILLLKKNKIIVKDTIFANLLTMLPRLILEAEQNYSDGQDKKLVVLSYALNWLCEMTGQGIDSIKAQYAEKTSEAIESILATPQKKGE